MTKGTKIWLWFALVLGLATTGINASYGRWISVAISLAAMAGLAVLLFQKRKAGYVFMCGCYVLSFVSGVTVSATTVTFAATLAQSTEVLLNLVSTLLA